MSGEFRDILVFIANDFFWIRRVGTEMTYVELRYYLGTESSFFLFTINNVFISVSFEYKNLRTELYVEVCTTEIPQQTNRTHTKRTKKCL